MLTDSNYKTIDRLIDYLDEFIKDEEAYYKGYEPDPFERGQLTGIRDTLDIIKEHRDNYGA